MNAIRVLPNEDNRLLREGITATINGQREMRVVVASAGKDTIVIKACTPKPRILLLDPGLRRQQAVQVATSLRRPPGGTRIGAGV